MPRKPSRHTTTTWLGNLPPGDVFLEVLDQAGRPLLVMPRDRVLRQRLRHRLVVVCLYDREGRVYIQKRASGRSLHPGLWTISAAGHVLAGEGRADAAQRELAEELGIHGLELTLSVLAPPSPVTNNAEVSLFSTNPVSSVPRLNPDAVEEGMFVDHDELRAMVTDLPHLLTPALIWTAGQLGIRTVDE